MRRIRGVPRLSMAIPYMKFREPQSLYIDISQKEGHAGMQVTPKTRFQVSHRGRSGAISVRKVRAQPQSGRLHREYDWSHVKKAWISAESIILLIF
jgi:hypothetical protein